MALFPIARRSPTSSNPTPLRGTNKRLLSGRVLGACIGLFVCFGLAGCSGSKPSTGDKESGAPHSSPGKSNETTFTVNAPGGGTVAVEVSPEVAEEIAIRDLLLTSDFLELRFKLTLKKDVDPNRLDWRYTAFDKGGAKVCDGRVHLQHTIKAGETIPASTVFVSPDKKNISKVVIHR